MRDERTQSPCQQFQTISVSLWRFMILKIKCLLILMWVHSEGFCISCHSHYCIQLNISNLERSSLIKGSINKKTHVVLSLNLVCFTQSYHAICHAAVAISKVWHQYRCSLYEHTQRFCLFWTILDHFEKRLCHSHKTNLSLFSDLPSMKGWYIGWAVHAGGNVL